MLFSKVAIISGFLPLNKGSFVYKYYAKQKFTITQHHLCFDKFTKNKDFNVTDVTNVMDVLLKNDVIHCVSSAELCVLPVLKNVSGLFFSQETIYKPIIISCDTFAVKNNILCIDSKITEFHYISEHLHKMSKTMLVTK